MRTVAAVILANLPVNWWGPFEDRFPLRTSAWISALVTLFAGFAIGIPGYLQFLATAADGFNAAVVFDPNLADASRGWAVGSLAVYLLATPQGLLATYLALGGLVRFASAFIVDDVRGDFLLTWLDAGVRKLWGRASARDARVAREKLEGPDMPDRLVTGDAVGRADASYVVLAARQKPMWERNSYLVTADGTAYRIGERFDLKTLAGLRTAYPIVELKTGEAIRHAIPYELPPLWRGRI
jgi:hypothetical protein